MKRTKYTTEFKEEAVKQVIDKGHAVPDVQGCGVSRAKPKRDTPTCNCGSSPAYSATL